MATMAERTGWRGFGLLPFFAEAARLPAEDAFSLGDKKARADGARDHRRADAGAHRQF